MMSGWNGGFASDSAANVGVGLPFSPQPRVALRLDLRQYVGAFRQAREFHDGWSDTRPFGGHPQLTAGVGFAF